MQDMSNKILWTSFEFKPYQTKNVDNMGKLSFTPLSKHALLCSAFHET